MLLTKWLYPLDQEIWSGFKIIENSKSKDTWIPLSHGATYAKTEEKLRWLQLQKNYLYLQENQEIIHF
jgi:hypothetical protein